MTWVRAQGWAHGRAVAAATARQGWHGLVSALAGPDPAAPWEQLTPGQQRAAYAAVSLGTVALGVINAGTAHGVGGPHGLRSPGPGQLVLALAVVTPLLLVIRSPMLAWRIGWTALLLAPVVPGSWWGGWPWGPPQIIAMIVVFCLAGLRLARAALWWTWGLTLVPWLLWLVADVRNLDGPITATVIFAAVAITVDSVGSHLRAQHALTAATARTAAERDRRTVLEERSRIARELHDVVAHHMSLIAVRAETAPFRISDLPEPVRAEFAKLSDVAREALTDMRRLLGVLRDDQPAALAPQPQLADLLVLVDAARQAGVPVELSLPARPGRVPAGVGVCAYRIVQESLSNAGQHSPGATVTVSVDQDDQAVVLRVANGPASGAGVPEVRAGAADRTGHGLAGMRERVTLLGGTLSAGPAADGGFVVSAVLPLSEPGITARDPAGAS